MSVADGRTRRWSTMTSPKSAPFRHRRADQTRPYMKRGRSQETRLPSRFLPGGRGGTRLRISARILSSHSLISVCPFRIYLNSIKTRMFAPSVLADLVTSRYDAVVISGGQVRSRISANLNGMATSGMIGFLTSKTRNDPGERINFACYELGIVRTVIAKHKVTTP